MRFNQELLSEIQFKTDFEYSEPESISIISRSIEFKEHLFINSPAAGDDLNKKVTQEKITDIESLYKFMSYDNKLCYTTTFSKFKL